jgi:uncharacterized membrane protein YbhN (UPF0104 family)
MKKFIQESWNEYCSFLKNNLNKKRRRIWIILLILIMEIFLSIIYIKDKNINILEILHNLIT